MSENSYNYIKHSKKIFFKGKIYPEYVTFFITTRCNFACDHCFYWKELNTEKNELKLEEIQKISNTMDEFNVIILTGGEPYLRADIAEIIKIFHKTNHIQNVITPTNGYFTDLMIKNISDVCESCPDLHYLVEVSIDDIGEKHNVIRRHEKAFEKAMITIDKLKELKKKYSNLSLGIICVFSQLNQHRIKDIYYYIRDVIKPDSITIPLIRGNPKENVKNIDISKYDEITEIIKKDFRSGHLGFNFRYSNVSKATTLLVRDLISNTYKTNSCQLTCHAGKISCVIYPNGDVMTCEMLNKKLGNLREVNYDFGKIWFSEETNKVTDWIKDTKCFCTHECNMTSNVLFSAKQWTKIPIEVMKMKLGQKDVEEKTNTVQNPPESTQPIAT